jgi:hypothetical protein
MMVKNRIILIAVITSSVSIAFFLMFTMTQANYVGQDKIPRAVIIDQLNDDYQNLDFQQTAKQYLDGAGYKVDIFTTKNVTVNFYKNLPSMGYKFILIRSHASVNPNNEQKPDSANLFTGEKYQTGKYTVEQLLGQVQKSSYIYMDYAVNYHNGTVSFSRLTSESGTYFSVGSKFVDEQMSGRFSGSIILIGGCTSLSNPILADSLTKRGASTIIGWDRLVRADHNDKVMLAVLKGLLVDKSNVGDVVQSTMKTFGPDPEFSAMLKYYPASSGSIHAWTD